MPLRGFFFFFLSF